MSRYKKQLGKVGEEYAAKYLEDEGYKILGRNVYVGGGEIDIVAKKNSLIVFIEVKTRKSDKYVDIADSIDDEKEDALITSCEEYLSTNNLEKCDFRIDLIGIVIRNRKVIRFEHVKGMM